MASALETMALMGVWMLLIATTAGSVRPGIYPRQHPRNFGPY